MRRITATSHGCPGERQNSIPRFTVGFSTYDIEVAIASYAGLEA